MKKILSAFITMAIILSVSACEGSTPEATTAASTDSAVTTTADNTKETAETTEAETTEETTTAETTTEETTTEETTTEETTAAETTTAETTTAETTTAEAATTEEAAATEATTEAQGEPAQGELIENNFLDGLKGKSPLYYEFGRITSTVPVTMTMTLLNEDGSVMGTMKMTMASLGRIAMATEASGESARIILEDGTNYIISDDEKYAMYYTLSEDERSAMEEEMLSSMQFATAFDFDKAEFTSGTEEFMGETLKYETVDDGTTSATLYFVPETGRAKYILSEGQTARIDDYYTGADESLFEIPEDYQKMDLESLMGDLTAAE